MTNKNGNLDVVDIAFVTRLILFWRIKKGWQKLVMAC